jgi:radical SAM protein with 4Fe4S-binding SPASM domain
MLQAMGARAGRPVGAHVQVADRCNHVCQHCYQVQGQRGELSLEDQKHVLGELARAGVLLINISGGEATLRSDLVEILAYARKLSFVVRLFTNAFNIDDALADAIAPLGLLEVQVSVYSDRADEHDSITGVKGSLVRTLAGIGRLRARGVRVMMKTPLLHFGADLAERMRSLGAQYGCEVGFNDDITAAEDGSTRPLEVAAAPEDTIAMGVIPPWHPSETDADAREMLLESAPCGVGGGGIAVLANGDVQPCTDTLIPLGNLLKDGLDDILARDGGFFRKLRWRDVHGCRDCDLMPACHRCHASARHEAADYLGPYATACSRARARYAASVGSLRVLEPDSGCEPGRSRDVGPYRIEESGVLRPVADVASADDELRAARFDWLRDSARRGSTPGGSAHGIVALRASRTGPALRPISAIGTESPTPR